MNTVISAIELRYQARMQRISDFIAAGGVTKAIADRTEKMRALNEELRVLADVRNSAILQETKAAHAGASKAVALYLTATHLSTEQLDLVERAAAEQEFAITDAIEPEIKDAFISAFIVNPEMTFDEGSKIIDAPLKPRNPYIVELEKAKELIDVALSFDWSQFSDQAYKEGVIALKAVSDRLTDAWGAEDPKPVNPVPQRPELDYDAIANQSQLTAEDRERLIRLIRASRTAAMAYQQVLNSGASFSERREAADADDDAFNSLVNFISWNIDDAKQIARDAFKRRIAS